MSVVIYSLGSLPNFVGDVLRWSAGQRQFQAKRSTNEVVNKLLGEVGKVNLE